MKELKSFLKEINYKRQLNGNMLKWKDIRISYIPINSDCMRSIADIPKLSEMPAVALEEERFKIWKEIKILR